MPIVFQTNVKFSRKIMIQLFQEKVKK